MSKKNGWQDYVNYVYDNLISVYKDLGDAEKEKAYMQLHITIKDTLSIEKEGQLIKKKKRI